MDSFMVWVDLEMTGLDIQTEVIMEMACVITDKDLNVMAESEDVIIKVSCKIGWVATSHFAGLD